MKNLTTKKTKCISKYDELRKNCTTTFNDNQVKINQKERDEIKELDRQGKEIQAEAETASKAHTERHSTMTEGTSTFGITNKLRSDAKRYNVKLTTMKYGRRYYKNHNVIRRQINNKNIIKIYNEYNSSQKIWRKNSIWIWIWIRYGIFF